MSDKRIIYRMYKELLQLYKKISDPVKNGAKDLNRQFFKDNVQPTCTLKDRCSISLVIMEIPIKTQ